MDPIIWIPFPSYALAIVGLLMGLLIVSSFKGSRTSVELEDWQRWTECHAPGPRNRRSANQRGPIAGSRRRLVDDPEAGNSSRPNGNILFLILGNMFQNLKNLIIRIISFLSIHRLVIVTHH